MNKARIPEMATYIINNPKDYVFSTLTASIDGDFEFSAINAEFDDKIGNHLYKNNPYDWKKILSNIKHIDWHRTNLDDWQNRVIGPTGRIVKSATYVRLTNNLIKIKLGISLSKDEIKLENHCRKED